MLTIDFYGQHFLAPYYQLNDAAQKCVEYELEYIQTAYAGNHPNLKSIPETNGLLLISVPINELYFLIASYFPPLPRVLRLLNAELLSTQFPPQPFIECALKLKKKAEKGL